MSLKFVLLTLLDIEPRTGYDLVRTFDTAVGYFWNASHQQVYRELGSMCDAKLLKFKEIQQDHKPDKKIYSLSKTGKTELQNWLTNPIKQQKNKDLLLVKLLNTNADNVHLMLEELERNTQASRTTLETFLGIEKMYYSAKQRRLMEVDQVMIYAALRKGILYIESHLLWLDEVKGLIKKTVVGKS